MKKAEEANAYYNKQPGKMNTYEASEGVKDMPIKQTEESHKKCSPGEFGMHKGGNDNAALLALLKQWEANGGGQSAYPMSANASPMKPLPPELAAALQAHMKLPAKMQPDELDAAETMMNLEGTLGGPKPAAGPMGKAGAFTFGQKLANDWMGFNYKNVGPGGLISTRTLPKADATAKSWGPAQPPVPPPSAATRVAVPNSPQQYNDIFQAHPGLKQISPNMQQNMRSRISQGGDYNVQPAAKTLSPASFGKNIFNKLQ